MIEDVVYIAMDDSLIALNRSTGRRLWTFGTGDRITAPPAVAHGTVYVGSWDSYLYALDAMSGDPLWSFETSDSISSTPTVDDDVVYVGSGTHYYAVGASDGQLLWNHQVEVHVSNSTPVVVDGRVYVGSLNGSLFALDASTAKQLWGRKVADQTPHLERVFTRPSVVDEVVYLGTDAGLVFALDASTGDEIWQVEVSTENVTHAPVVVDGLVLVSTYDGRVHGLNAESGDVVWRYKAGSGILRLTTVDGLVYVRAAQLGDPVVLSASDGEPLWPRSGPDVQPTDATVLERTAYVAPRVLGSENSVVYAKDPIDGRVLWQFELEGRARSQATTANGILYVVSIVHNADRYLYALRGPDEE